jgi:hypothetical protein
VGMGMHSLELEQIGIFQTGSEAYYGLGVVTHRKGDRQTPQENFEKAACFFAHQSPVFGQSGRASWHMETILYLMNRNAAHIQTRH